MTTTLTPLKWTTKINATTTTGLKIAKTHFGTEYTLVKDGPNNWDAKVTAPALFGRYGGTETLLSGVSFTRARKAATDDYERNGGR